ncbi:MAG: helix-turn-helix transcriptional regulator [Alphaproteobacteria bacterium]|nr:helix-turn-helix transcriptional regulator [Alphaproteobacteria bacterium]
MTRFDRLSSLMVHFELGVEPTEADDVDLFVYADRASNQPSRVVLCPHKKLAYQPFESERLAFKAEVNWGGESNPLFSALPDVLELDLTQDGETAAIVTLLKVENDNKRCGSASVLSRLAEILIIRLMRVQIEQGKIRKGLFGGLNDKRLGRAIVAMHDNPSKKWKNEDLAQIAGLSLSRFCELFSNVVQETPMGYLRRWRLILARQDIVKGARGQNVAVKYGYQSGEALSRAFHKQFGETPTNVRKQSLELAV